MAQWPASECGVVACELELCPWNYSLVEWGMLVDSGKPRNYSKSCR